MLKIIQSIVNPMPPAPDEMRERALAQAKIMLEEHVQAAEHHRAQIGLYQERIARLTATAPKLGQITRAAA